MPITSLLQSRRSFCSETPPVLIDTISPPSPQQIALVWGLWALCLWGPCWYHTQVTRIACRPAGLLLFLHLRTVTRSQGGIEVGRGAVRNDQSQAVGLVLRFPKIRNIASRGLKQLVMGSKLHVCYCEKWEWCFRSISRSSIYAILEFRSICNQCFNAIFTDWI